MPDISARSESHASTTVVIIGAGQAGLAMSRCLSDRALDHVVLERGEVAQRVADPSAGTRSAC